MAARSEVKRAVVYGALAFLTMWPAVHIGLALRYEISPWKLAGWGMYATPRFGSLGMEVFYEEAGGTGRRQLVMPTAAEHAVANAFLERHRWLRRLARPDRFARVILEGRPEIERLEIVVFRPDMEATTGMIVMRRAGYDYER